MKTLMLFSLLLLFTACKKESASNTPATETVQPGAAVQAKGSFVNGPYGRVSGVGKVVRNANNTYDVVLDSFMTNNGPDLYVYLSKEAMPVTFIEVGKLRSTGGTQVYSLTAAPDLSQYKYICIHCKAFNHLFGYAQLP
ncbi:DM13 domain-containing protein [Flavitalea antarctica]